MKNVLIFLADGCEEVESLTIVDVLRRGGVNVEMVSITDKLEIVGAHGIKFMAELKLSELDIKNADYLLFPGGMPGAENLANSKLLIDILKEHLSASKGIGAICAAPALVLSKLNREMTITCYPGFGKFFPKANILTDGVVVDGLITTGKGPAYAMPFAIKVLEQLTTLKNANDVASGLLMK